MPDIIETPVTVEEFMNPKSEIPSNNSSLEGEYSYPNYYTMLSNIANASMATNMNSYNPTSVNLSTGTIERESKDQDNDTSKQNQKGNLNSNTVKEISWQIFILISGQPSNKLFSFFQIYPKP